MAQIASFFKHNEYLPKQISVTVDQKERTDCCPWFVPDVRHLLRNRLKCASSQRHTKHTSSVRVRR